MVICIISTSTSLVKQSFTRCNCQRFDRIISYCISSRYRFHWRGGGGVTCSLRGWHRTNSLWQTRNKHSRKHRRPGNGQSSHPCSVIHGVNTWQDGGSSMRVVRSPIWTGLEHALYGCKIARFCQELQSNSSLSFPFGPGNTRNVKIGIKESG